MHVEKIFRLFDGEHNSCRPLEVVTEAVRWLKQIYEKNFMKQFDEKLS